MRVASADRSGKVAPTYHSAPANTFRVADGMVSSAPERRAHVGTLHFWFEFASTYSYPAAMRIAARAEAAGVALAWRPFLLGPIFQAQGWNDSPFNVYPIKGRYMWRDLERLCAKEDVPLRRPSRFPRPSLIGARVACLGARESWVPRSCAPSTARTSPPTATSVTAP